MKPCPAGACQDTERWTDVLQHTVVSRMHAVTAQLTLWQMVQDRHQPTACSALLQKHLTRWPERASNWHKLMPQAEVSLDLSVTGMRHANHAASISSAAAPQASFFLCLM